MHFSCKITNAVLSFLELRGEDLSSLYDPALPPMEAIRDPSSWMSAPDMERYLETLVRLNWRPGEQPMLVEAGHAGPKNFAWGPLDSVMRMMPRPQEIFNQPERFLSYFISPEPPVENLFRDETSLSFDLPLPAEQYPLVTQYLKAAFESLPVYVGQGFATCEWTDIHLRLQWPENTQESIFAVDPGHQVSPELLESVIADHQRLQRELETRNRELQSRDEEVVTLRRDLAQVAVGNENAKAALLARPESTTLPSLHERDPRYEIEQNLSRLQDYMVRAQQLITMLTGSSKQDPAVKAALRRLDWDYVKVQYPRAVSESMKSLRKLHGVAVVENSHSQHPLLQTESSGKEIPLDV